MDNDILLDRLGRANCDRRCGDSRCVVVRTEGKGEKKKEKRELVTSGH